MNAEMRKSALRRYLVFRVKAMEFLDLGVLRQALKQGDLTLSTGPVTRLGKDMAESLRTYQLSCFAIFIDKTRGGLDVLDLWAQLFPQLSIRIDSTRLIIEQPWKLLRKFRDKAGFHADMPIAFFGARREVALNAASLAAPLEKFHALFKEILHAEEATLPDLSSTLDVLLDELELTGTGSTYRREEFRRYLMMKG